jgi:tRNA threonylcarbamoyl adenosine modification protein YeaZ
MHERLVLALDGSTGVCGAALLRSRPSPGALTNPGLASSVKEGADERLDENGLFEVLARRSRGDGRAQAKVLLRLVDEMLEEVGRRSTDLGAVVVGKGPGTFTGVRVTVATARALSVALAIPVIGVSTLGALAAAAVGRTVESSPVAHVGTGAPRSPERWEAIVPVVDARRGQLFYGFYHSTEFGVPPGPGRWARKDEFAVCDRGALDDLLGPARTVVVGEETLRPQKLPPASVFLSCDVAAEHLVIGQECLEEPSGLPEGRRLAAWLGSTLAGDAVVPADVFAAQVLGGPGTPESVTPIYVRSPDADVHITRMKDPWAESASGR